MLEAVEIVEGPFLESVGQTIVAQLYAAPVAGSDTLGEVYYAAAGISYKTASGSGILLNVTFTVLSQGSQQFHLLPYDNRSSKETGTFFADINYNKAIPNLRDAFYGSPVSLTVSQGIIEVGGSLTVSGKVSGSTAGNITSVDLQIKPLIGGDWAHLASLQTDSSGHFSYQWSPSENGAFEFQVSFIYAGNTTNSTVVEVIVQPGLQGYGTYVMYAAVGVIALIIAAAIILRVRTYRKQAAEKPPI